MSDVKKIATRDSYGNALVELGKLHENVVVLDADLAACYKDSVCFRKAFPERHIDCGIAEGNMIGCCSRTCYDRKGSICKLVCDVCSRTCI